MASLFRFKKKRILLHASWRGPCLWGLMNDEFETIFGALIEMIFGFNISNSYQSFPHAMIFLIWNQILKHEWPAKWRSFIPDLVSAARTSETICENCMAILKVDFWTLVYFTKCCYILHEWQSSLLLLFSQLLSEEVFDFSRGEMTQQKIKELKQSLNR